jgi:hypothetical protein
MWWKAAVFIWPFLRELVLGEKTLKQAVQSNKIRVLAIGIIFLSLALNFFALPRLVSITNEYLTLSKKYKDVAEQLKELQDKKNLPHPPVATPPEAHPPADSTPAPRHPMIPAPQPAGKSKEEDERERLRKLRERLEKLEREENDQRIKDALRNYR